MFEPQSPRLPVGSTLTASIEQSKGALIVHVKPESVRLSENELPKRSFERQGKDTTKLQKRRLKRKFYLDTSSQLPMDKEVNCNTQAKKKRNFCLNIEIPNLTVETEREPEPNRTLTQPTIKQLLSPDASIVLHQSIKSQHQKTGENQLKIDSKGEWTATVRGHDCKVSNRHKKVVFQSNLAIDKIDKPLSEANAEQFFKMCEQETKKESLNPKKTNRLKRKSKQEQLSI